MIWAGVLDIGTCRSVVRSAGKRWYERHAASISMVATRVGRHPIVPAHISRGCSRDGDYNGSLSRANGVGRMYSNTGGR